MKKFWKKKIIAVVLAGCLCFALAACGEKGSAATGAATEKGTAESKGPGVEGGLKIVTTIFPEYDWVREVVGDNPAGADITLLLDNGADLHSYQPTAEDIMKISTCDLFIYAGGESDKWVDDALKEASNPNMQVIDLLEVVGDSAKEEEIIEGMQEDHDHEDADEDHDHEEADEDHDHEDAEEDHDHHHEGGEKEYDEHVWLSLKNADRIVGVIAEKLEVLDPSNKSVYDANAKAYSQELKKLDSDYQTAVNAAKTKTILFGDRFPFRYLVDDYGISYFAAFVGCSAETEASFETITFLSGKVDELGLKAVFKIEGSNGKIAETIVRSTKAGDQKILTLNSMQGTTAQDIADGATYLKIMNENLSVLKEGMQ